MLDEISNHIRKAHVKDSLIVGDLIFKMVSSIKYLKLVIN